MNQQLATKSRAALLFLCNKHIAQRLQSQFVTNREAITLLALPLFENVDQFISNSIAELSKYFVSHSDQLQQILEEGNFSYSFGFGFNKCTIEFLRSNWITILSRVNIDTDVLLSTVEIPNIKFGYPNIDITGALGFGKIEEGENLETACFREAKEESWISFFNSDPIESIVFKHNTVDYTVLVEEGSHYIPKTQQVHFLAKILSKRAEDWIVAVRQDTGHNFLKNKTMVEVIPKKGEKNILITSALPYVNNVPHLGNIIGAMLSADAYARYCRQRGYNTLYICGTDEYGTATEAKALEEGLTVQEICDKYHKIHKEVYDWFDIKFDKFGRTTTEWQTKIAQDIFTKLYKDGHLIENSMEQLYDPIVKKFLADRFVKGICPHCQFEDARGDQCDRCGKLLNPMDLINPRSILSNSAPEKVKTDHLFLNLTELQPKLEEWVKTATTTGDWSNIATVITDAWLKEGLKPRCITRDLKWGTPVPLEKYKEKVFYVWFDAPIGYISITANYSPENWEKWWKNPEDVKLVQFMGKDNVPFHSVIFPSSLIGTGENWTMVDSLSSTEYLNYEDGKFSKSRGIGVFGDQAKITGIPSEIWRYYLLTNRPEQSDTVFLWEDFQAKINNELLANLGNYVNRVLKFVESNFESRVPEIDTNLFTDRERNLIVKINEYLEQYVNAMEKTKLKEGLHICLFISKLGNQHLQETKPWELVKTDKKLCGTVLGLNIQITKLLTAILEPFMPSFSTKLLTQMGITIPEGEENLIKNELELSAVPAGHQIGKPAPLISQLDTATMEHWKEKFGGGREQKEKLILDLRVAEILSVEDHPSAEKLYKMKVKVGDKEERQIIGGLKEAYPNKEDLQGRKVVAVCNLKHAKLKGETSEGMLLVGKTQSGDNVGLLGPIDKSVPAGTILKPEAGRVQPEKVIAPKVLQEEMKKLSIGQGSVAQFLKQPLAAAGVLIKADRDIPEGSGIY